MIADEDLLPLSALQHVVYCERQAALIHVERLWAEDAATAAGRVLHEHVHEAGAETRAGWKVRRAMPLRSTRLGVQGVADVVELRAEPEGVLARPVEFKRGRRKNSLADQVQLCAQAMCLEEELGIKVPVGVLYYAASHRRLDVELDAELRDRTMDAAVRMHGIMRDGIVPPPVYEPRKCGACSLKELCMPEALQDRSRSRRHIQQLLRGE